MHLAPVRIARLSLWILLGTALQVQAQSPPASAVTVSVEGIEDTAGYAAVTALLESVVSLQGLSVEELNASTVVYRVRAADGLPPLTAALAEHAQLQPLPDANSAALRFRYRP